MKSQQNRIELVTRPEECVHDQGGGQCYLNVDFKVALVHVKSDGGSRDQAEGRNEKIKKINSIVPL